MAQVVLSSIGQSIGGAPGAAIGNFIGRTIDQAVISSLTPARQRGPRLDGLKIQGTSEGAPMACVFGRARVAGQVIWAARFQEDRHTSSAGKAGPRTVEYGYSLSFAVALCEGEIDGVGRVWADGQPMDLAGVAFRIHRGGEEQAPDPLIEAIEGSAPAYRGTAYVVFEDLPLGPFGNRAPQLAFEVFRRPTGEEARLEEQIEGMCLIPGAGEFVLATEPVLRREGLTRTRAENAHGGGQADLIVSLDRLQAQAPNLRRVSLVIGWFGDDLRASHCRIRPGVERREKPTEPLVWSVAGLDRADAHLISQIDGGPAFGGTPSDNTVKQAVRELKARGLEVTLYPFVFMDIPAGNALPDPDGGAGQPAYPWRGRIRARDGVHAADEVHAVVGGEGDWGLRRLALHYAALAAESGADGLLIGSEMRGLTFSRDDAGQFPAVEAFCALASECRAVAGSGVRLSYAADWSEYAGPRRDGEVRFHLDPLWAHPDIDYVGIDWYPPLGDWREDGGGLDGAVWVGPDDPGYLSANVAGGEGFAWFYRNDADRAAQARTPIADLLVGEDWVYRVKDLAGWWGHAHHDRIGGERSATPTAWAPGMKPVRLTELGCAAVNRGANAPNRFQDPKSSEHALPPFSTGSRDDKMQRRALEALLGHFSAHNPVSEVYGGPMLEGADLWCWDARPWPEFPAREDVWADAAGWAAGHWLNGRLHGETRDLIASLLRRAGVEDFEIDGISGEVQGYVVDRPMGTRDALLPLLEGLGLRLAERNGRITVVSNRPSERFVSKAELALPEEGQALSVNRITEVAPGSVRVRFIDGGNDYQTGTALVRGAGDGGGIDIDLPAVCDESTAIAVANGVLAANGADHLTISLAPLLTLELEPADTVEVEGQDGQWRVLKLDVSETTTATLEPITPYFMRQGAEGPKATDYGELAGAPFFRLMDLPPLLGGESDGRPVAVVASEPWRRTEIRAGVSMEDLTVRAEASRAATVGRLIAALRSGVRHRWDQANTITVQLEGRSPQSRTMLPILAGANSLAVETETGWEIVQFQTAELVEGDVWRLSGLLRGQQGTDAAMRTGAPSGAVVVLLDEALPRVALSESERGLPLVWRAGAAGLPGGPAVSEVQWTWMGVHARPWSPAHLTAVSTGEGLRMSWIPRARIDGDRWDGPYREGEAGRFRVRISASALIVRTFEVLGASCLYASESQMEDFPEGLPVGVGIEVAEWSDDYGWGEPASITI